MAKIKSSLDLGGAIVIFTFDDVTMKMIEYYVNNQTQQRIIVKCTGGEREWTKEVTSLSGVYDEKIVSKNQLTFEWKEFIDKDTQEIRRVQGGFNLWATLGK